MAEPLTGEEREAIAAELALGVLEGEERAFALRLYAAEPDFAAAVEAWRARLAPLYDAVPDVSPPAYLWRQIEARISTDGPRGIVQSLRLWRGAAILSGAIAAGLALFLLVGRPQVPTPLPAPLVVAQLVGQDPAAGFTAAYDAASGTLRIDGRTVVASAKAAELWIIPAGGVPRSLGIVKEEGRSSILLAPELRGAIAPGATLAITIEDRATAPHSAPSSAPVVAGKIATI